MQKTKLLLGVIVALVVAFIGFRIFNQDVLADNIQPIILPLVLVYYWTNGYDRKTYFFLFLLFYAISEIISLVFYYVPESDLFNDLNYFGCNILYIIAYIFLIMEIIKPMNLSEIFNRFAVHLVILLILDIYCVILVSEVAIKSESLTSIYDNILEITYNVVIMILLTAALINYLSRDSKKAMNILLGCLCIVFSEVIQVAYYYVSEINILSISYSILLVLAFYFFYIQSSMSYEESNLVEHTTNEVNA